jgi:hypothetical protein
MPDSVHLMYYKIKTGEPFAKYPGSWSAWGYRGRGMVEFCRDVDVIGGWGRGGARGGPRGPRGGPGVGAGGRAPRCAESDCRFTMQA